MDIVGFFNKNKEYIIFMVVFVILVMIGVYFLGSGGTEPDGERTPVIVPLDTSQNGDYDWGSISFTSSTAVSPVAELSVYEAKLLTLDDITGIVNRLGFAGTGQITSKGLYHYWGTDEEFARYNTQIGNLNVNSPGIVLTELYGVSPSQNGMENYVNQFIEEYLELDMDASMVITRQDGQYRVEGVWTVGGYDVVLSNGTETSFSMNFGENGDLLALSLDAFEVRSSDEVVDMITISELTDYISLDSYPKEAYISAVASASDCADNDPECDPYGFYTLNGFSNARITSAEIVYYYDNLQGSGDVIPVYRLDGTATSEDDDGNSHTVDITIYANAVNPSQIITSPAE